MINATVRSLVEARELDQFINTWTCRAGGRHRVYRLCDCPGAHLDVEALKHGVLQVVSPERKS